MTEGREYDARWESTCCGPVADKLSLSQPMWGRLTGMETNVPDAVNTTIRILEKNKRQK